MASGLGKTLTSAFDVREFLEKHPSSHILVLCHSANILGQTREIFRTFFGDEYSYGMFNGAEKAVDKTDFLFANLQSVNLHKDAFEPDEYAYIIVDEAHHSPARTYRQAIEHFKPEFLLGLTATPERMDDADLTEIFGETVFEYRMEDAIKDGWLASIDYHVKTDELSKLAEILDSNKKLTLSQLNREIFVPKRDEEIVRIIQEEIKAKDNPTTVIFCQTIEHADKIAELMNAVVIHSNLSLEEREHRLEGFRTGKIKTVCAVDILNEGIDVPRTDVIVFLRVTQSKIVFIQQLGRGLRLAEGKDNVLVLDFVAAADRLEMLFQLENEFQEATERYPRGKNAEREQFILDIDSTIFRDRKVDIITLIKEARSYHSRVTDEELIQDFRKECKRLERFPRHDEFYYHNRKTYLERFGDWRKIAELADCLEYWDEYCRTAKGRKLSDEELLQDFHRECEDLGHFPKKDEFHYHSSYTYLSRFKTWENISKLADCLEYWDEYCRTAKGRKYSDKELLQDFRKECEDLGHFPMVDECHYHNLYVYLRKFKNRENLAKLAGCEEYYNEYLRTASGLKISDEELLQDFRKECEDLGRFPMVDECHYHYFYTYLERFENREKLAELSDCTEYLKAFYQTALSSYFTDEELARDFRKECKDLGHFPKKHECHYHSYSSYLARFKTRENLAESSGCIDYLKKYRAQGFTDEELIRDFRRECEDLGHFPKKKEFHYHSGRTYLNRFKTWENLAKLADCMKYWENRPRKRK